ncbi:MAG: 50S ribosomal protein L10 [Bacillota bacterium]|nr:50S ribosomal protein L10 [Bacillota bacterium]
MAKIQSKQEIVAEVTEKLQQAQSVVIADYRGLNVAQVTKLRSELRQSGIDFKVIKNTLTKIAAKNAGVEGLDTYLEGPTAIAFGIEDAVAPAKILSKFAKDNKALEIKGGLIEGKIIDLDGVKALADLPSREELLAKVLRGMQSPLYGFANVLQGNLRNLVNVVDAVRKQKEAS